MKEIPVHTVQFFREYGVYRVPGATIVSVPNWKAAWETIQSNDFGPTTAFLPELVTIAGKELRSVGSYREEVEESLADVTGFSRSRPDTTYIVGSPHYAISGRPPFNAAFVIRDGEIRDIFHKRINASEIPFLTVDPETPAAVVNGAGLLICRDLFGASNDYASKAKALLIQQSNRIADPQEALRLALAPYIDPATDTVGVISCWGVGMWLKRDTPMIEDEVNSYYQRSLETIIGHTFMSNPNLRRIVMSDRAPTSARLATSTSATKPLSFIATRS